MSSILMVSYAWPPLGGVGMIRMAKFAKYLIKFGHRVTVLTRGGSNGNIHWDIKEPELDRVNLHTVNSPQKKYFFHRINQRINPQLELDWFYSVNSGLKELLKDIKCDVLISSSPPESAHLIALTLKKKLNKPWIADLRDLWSYDHYRNFNIFYRAFLSRQEKNVLKNADRIVTVSEEWAEFLRKRYGNRVRVITNAFDEDWYGASTPVARDKFRISYLGKLNAYHQNIFPFLNAVRDIVHKGDVSREKFEINFYISGYGKPDIKKMTREMGLEKVVNEYEPVSLGKAVDIIRNSELLLLVGWTGLSAAGWRPQKVYEYLGSGVPVLLTNNLENKELTELLVSTGSGVAANDVGSVKKEILGRYVNFIVKNADKPSRAKNTLTEYRADNVTRKLHRLVEEVKGEKGRK